MKNVTALLKVYPPYPSDPLADWPVLLYKIVFSRSWQPYIRGYLVSQVIFNLIGFACFWLPIASGERLGLAITAMLSAVAADLVVVSKLPSASELTWMQKFSMVSQVFAAFCVIEGVVVSYFFYQTSANLIPSYLACIFNAVKKRRSKSKAKKNSSSMSGSSGNTSFIGDKLSSMASMRPRDANDFLHNVDIEHNNRWKKYAENLDDFSRVFIPVVYLILLSIFLADIG